MDSDLMRWVKAQADDPNANPRFRELLAALEAAREDAERLDSGTIRIIERDEFGMQHTTAYSGVDLRAAIDQARGKAGQEVGK